MHMNIKIMNKTFPFKNEQTVEGNFKYKMEQEETYSIVLLTHGF